MPPYNDISVNAVENLLLKKKQKGIFSLQTLRFFIKAQKIQYRAYATQEESLDEEKALQRFEWLYLFGERIAKKRPDKLKDYLSLLDLMSFEDAFDLNLFLLSKNEFKTWIQGLLSKKTEDSSNKDIFFMTLPMVF